MPYYYPNYYHHHPQLSYESSPGTPATMRTRDNANDHLREIYEHREDAVLLGRISSQEQKLEDVGRNDYPPKKRDFRAQHEK